MSALQTLALSLRHSAINGETVTIGGGRFTPAELREAVSEIALCRAAVAQCDELVAALRDCVRYMNKPSDFTGTEMFAFYDAARAALAKVTKS